MRGVWLTRTLFLCFVVATVYGGVMFDTSTISSGDVPEQGEELEPLQGATAEDQPESADADGAEFDESAAEDSPEEKTPKSANTSSISPTFFLAGGLGGLGFILLSGLFFEFMKVVLLVALVVPMLAVRKTHQEDQLTKGRILGYIEANAGIHFSALRDGLHLSNGVTAYHANNLEKEGKIFSWKDGKNRRYASTYIPKSERKAIRNPLSGTRLAILEVLAEKGQIGTDTKEIRERLAISRQLLSHHFNELKANELIERNQEKKKCWRASERGLQQLHISRTLQEGA